MLLRLILGFCIAGLMLVVESWTNARATVETRGKLLATYMVLFYLASSMGQFLIALGDPAQHQLFIAAAILVCFSLIPLSLTSSTAPELEDSERLGVRQLWRASELGVSGAFLSGIAMSAFSAVGPIYAFKLGLAIEQIGAFMGISILAAMLLQWPMGYLSDYLPRRVVLVGVTLATIGAGLLAATAAGRSVFLLYATAALFYGLGTCIYPIALSLTHDVLSQKQVVPASATFLLAFGIGTTVGPILGGASVGVFGPAELFLFVAASLSPLILLSIHSFAAEKAPPVAEQSHCMGVAPISTPVLIELDLRNEEFEENPEMRMEQVV
ncbi:MAG: MFS transporter [Bryobacteraceae bacterium]